MSSPEPSAARTRGRCTPTRRPPRVTEPCSWPWRTAARSGLCLPLGPANATTDSSIIVPSTCSPAPTANASRPSLADSAISASATLTSAGMVSPSVLASTAAVWYCLPMAVPFQVVFLADHPRPTRRQGSGGGPPPQVLRTAGQPRRRAVTRSFQQSYRRWRPMVERSIAWLVADGCRRVAYRGIGRNDLWWSLRVAAVNLRRLLVLGLARHDDAWVLA